MKMHPATSLLSATAKERHAQGIERGAVHASPPASYGRSHRPGSPRQAMPALPEFPDR
jgi:hypothetical protein